MNEMAPAVAAADGEARLAWGPPPPHWGPPPPHWGPPPPHWGPGPILPPNVLPNLLPHILHEPQPDGDMPGDGNETDQATMENETDQQNSTDDTIHFFPVTESWITVVCSSSEDGQPGAGECREDGPAAEPLSRCADSELLRPGLWHGPLGDAHGREGLCAPCHRRGAEQRAACLCGRAGALWSCTCGQALGVWHSGGERWRQRGRER